MLRQLKAKWPAFSDGDRAVMLREIEQHIKDEERGLRQLKSDAWEVEIRTWAAFHDWAKSFTHPDREGKGGERI